MRHPFIQGGKLHKGKHLLPVFRGHQLAAEIGQPILGIAGGADVRMDIVYGESSVNSPVDRSI